MMRKQLLAVAVSGVAALALVSPGADAAPHQRSTASGVAVKHLDTSKAEHDRIVAYWTPKRMREAIPGDVLVANRDKSSATGQVEMGKPTVIQPQAKPGTGGGGSGFTGGYYPETPVTAVHKTTGKVFFTLGGSRYVCSGSSTSSTNGSVVTTAGHCLNEGPGAFATNFMFAPGYNDGATPNGEWTATDLLTTTQWANSGDFNYDVGFAVVGKNAAGQTLTQAVGTQGIAFNTSSPVYGQTMHSFGYPAASPYDGSDLAWCWGTTIRDTFGGSSDYGLNCNLTGGSSGGPWFFGFDGASGTGTQGSVNSFKYRGGQFKNYMWGPVFGSVVEGVYNVARSTTP